MFKSPFFQSYWFSEAVRVLTLEAILVFLFWLLYQFAGFLNNYPFGDVLFIAGGVMLFVAGFGMMRGDTELTAAPRHRGPKLEVQQTDGDDQEDSKRKLSLGIRLAICGALTILISLVMYLINKAGG